VSFALAPLTGRDCKHQVEDFLPHVLDRRAGQDLPRIDVVLLSHNHYDHLDLPTLRRLAKEHRARIVAPLGVSAVLARHGDRLAFTTDSYVVDPLFFPGGDIGTLAVSGTVNDLVVSGAKPLFLSCSVVIEEGLPVELLRRVRREIGDIPPSSPD